MTSVKRILSYCVVIRNHEQLFLGGSGPKPTEQIFKNIKPVLSGVEFPDTKPTTANPSSGRRIYYYIILIPITPVKATLIMKLGGGK